MCLNPMQYINKITDCKIDRINQDLEPISHLKSKQSDYLS